MSDPIEVAIAALISSAGAIDLGRGQEAIELPIAREDMQAAIAAYLEAQWQPIETVPDDVSRILVCNPDTGFIAIQRAGYFKPPIPLWTEGIILWQPLPEPPKEAK